MRKARWAWLTEWVITTHLSHPATDVTVGLEALIVADAMRAFVDSGLIELLELQQPISSDDLGRRAHMAPRALRLLLDVLAEAGVVRSAGQATWELNGSGAEWTNMIRSSAVGPFLDRGVGAIDISDPTSQDRVSREYRTVTGIISGIVRPIAEEWAPRLVRRAGTMLEIGAGAAPWARALLASEPTMRATLVDLGPVLDAHRSEIVAELPEASISFVGADVFSIDLVGRFDVVTICNFCRLFDYETNERLFARVANWLAPDGIVVITDAVGAPASRNRSLAVYELGLATRAASGQVYALEDFARWLAAAGLTTPESHATYHGALTVLTTARP